MKTLYAKSLHFKRRMKTKDDISNSQAANPAWGKSNMGRD